MMDAPTSNARRASQPLWAVLVLVFCAPLIYAALTRVRMVNDVETWLPAHDVDAQILAWSHENFEPENRFLMSWDSSSLADPRVLELATRLAPAEFPLDPTDPLSAVTRVVTPHGVISTMLENGVEREEAIRRLTGVLIGTGLLKVRLTEAGRRRRSEVEEQLLTFARDELRVEPTIVPPVAGPPAVEVPPAEGGAAGVEETDDPHVFRTTDWHPPEHDFQVRWRGLHPGTEGAERLQAYARGLRAGGAPLVEECFFAAGAPVAITVSLREEGDERLQQTLAAVRRAAREVGIPAEELRLGGSPIGRAQLNYDSFRAVWNPDYPWWMFHKRTPLGLSAVVGTVLAFLLLRSVRLAVLVLVTSLYMAAVVVALVPATGKTLNTVLIVMPNLLLVLTMSGAIHVANYWRHTAWGGIADPIRAAVRMAVEPCTLASVTTAIGLASLLTSVLEPVRQFGLYSAIGCLLSLGMVLWALPALMRVWPGRPAPVAPPHEDVWYQLGWWLVRHRRWITATCLGLFVLSAWGLHWFRTETKVIRYFPPSSRIVQDYQFLEDHLAGIVGVDVIVRFPPERKSRVLDDEELEETIGEGGASDRPSEPEVAQLDLFERLETIRRVQERLESAPGVTGTLSLADFRRPSAGRSSDSRVPYGRRLQIAKKQIFETYAASTREFVTLAVTPLSVERDGLPFRIERGEEVWRIRTQCSVLTDRHYREFLNEIDAAIKAELRGLPGVEHVVTGMVPLFLRTQEAVLESLINSFGLAFVVIAGVMMYLLRGVVSGAITMLPNILPVGVVFGAISWWGIPVDIGTMITASVALGIAIDGTLHLLTWFRDGLARGLSREEAIARSLGHCASALWQTSTAIALGLLMLVFADLLLISRFGWLMAALIAAALLGDLVYLPALLAGRLGRLIESSLPGRSAGASAETRRAPSLPETVPPE